MIKFNRIRRSTIFCAVLLLVSGCAGNSLKNNTLDDEAQEVYSPDKNANEIGEISQVSMDTQDKAGDELNNSTNGQSKEVTDDEESSSLLNDSSPYNISGDIVTYKVISDEMLETDEGNDSASYVIYDQIIFSESTKEKYPQLTDSVESMNNVMKATAMESLAGSYYYIKDFVEEQHMPFSDIYTINVDRADDTLFAYTISHETISDGPHPFYDTQVVAIETLSGNQIYVNDVVKDTEELADLIIQNLDLDNEVEMTDEELEDAKVQVDNMVKDNSLPWTLDENSFHVDFPAGSIFYYAIGPVSADLSLKKYTNLVNEKFLQYSVDNSIAKRFTSSDAETISVGEFELSEYYSEGDAGFSEDNVYLYLNQYDYYISDNVSDNSNDCKIEITERENHKSDWLDQSAWSGEYGVTLPACGYDVYYADDEYGYCFENNYEYGTLILSLYSPDGNTFIKSYNFSEFINSPSINYEDPFSDVIDCYIKYAKVYDGILYVSIGHNTYSSANPVTSYIVAVDLGTNEVLWRSQNLVAGSNNFIVGPDTIICGYGFTAEDDYIYVLNRNNGKVTKQIKVNSAPDYFIPIDDSSMYVLTYDTWYIYDIKGNWN